MKCIIRYDMRAQATGQNRNLAAEREFTPPDMGELLDWVLILDDASKHYAPPGSP